MAAAAARRPRRAGARGRTPPRAPPAVAYTIGHSTRPLEELVEALRAFGVTTLFDVRRIPRSRTNPQFNTDALPGPLAAAGIAYVHAPGLGGRRGGGAGEASPNAGWQVSGFRNYADYALTPAFAAAFDELLARCRAGTCAVMCAEATWWRCHRRIIADYLLAAGLEVFHILTPSRADPAALTPFARVRADGRVEYPAGDARQLELLPRARRR